MTDQTPDPVRARAVSPDGPDSSSTAPVDTDAGRRNSTDPRLEGRDAQHEGRRDTLRREKAEFGGMRFFLAFFGWLTATGLAVLLTAVITGVLAALGVEKTASTATLSTGGTQAAGIVGIIVVAVVLLVSYAVGGYVAGRMARFSGLKQGLAVWLWALIIAVLAAVAGAVSANATGALSQLSTAGLPVSGSTATAAGIVALVVAVVFSLVGALLGGLAGMRFHRKVDRFAGRV